MLGLVPLGVISGIPIALGLIPANSFVLIAAISACMIGRGLFRGEGQAAASVAPFLAISWSILAGLQRFDTLDIGAAMGAQGVFGPFAGFASHPWTWALFPIGLLAAPLWVVQLPRIGGGDHVALDRLFGIGETALSAVAVSGPLWGPSLGALVYGPLDSNAFAASATSFLVTLMFVGLVTRFKDFVPRQYALGWALAGLGLAVLVVSEVAG